MRSATIEIDLLGVPCTLVVAEHDGQVLVFLDYFTGRPPVGVDIIAEKHGEIGGWCLSAYEGEFMALEPAIIPITRRAAGILIGAARTALEMPAVGPIGEA